MIRLTADRLEHLLAHRTCAHSGPEPLSVRAAAAPHPLLLSTVRRLAYHNSLAPLSCSGTLPPALSSTLPSSPRFLFIRSLPVPIPPSPSRDRRGAAAACGAPSPVGTRAVADHASSSAPKATVSTSVAVIVRTRLDDRFIGFGVEAVTRTVLRQPSVSSRRLVGSTSAWPSSAAPAASSSTESRRPRGMRIGASRDARGQQELAKGRRHVGFFMKPTSFAMLLLLSCTLFNYADIVLAPEAESFERWWQLLERLPPSEQHRVPLMCTCCSWGSLPRSSRRSPGVVPVPSKHRSSKWRSLSRAEKCLLLGPGHCQGTPRGTRD